MPVEYSCYDVLFEKVHRNETEIETDGRKWIPFSWRSAASRPGTYELVTEPHQHGKKLF
jgi:hypothetical protein